MAKKAKSIMRLPKMSSLSLYLNSLRIGEEKEVTTPD